MFSALLSYSLLNYIYYLCLSVALWRERTKISFFGKLVQPWWYSGVNRCISTDLKDGTLKFREVGCHRSHIIEHCIIGWLISIYYRLLMSVQTFAWLSNYSTPFKFSAPYKKCTERSSSCKEPLPGVIRALRDRSIQEPFWGSGWFDDGFCDNCGEITWNDIGHRFKIFVKWPLRIWASSNSYYWILMDNFFEV